MAESNWYPWVWVKWKQGTSTVAWEGWQGHPKIRSAWSTQGDWDCVLRVDAASPDELEDFVWNTVRTNQWVADTSTNWAKKLW